MLAITKHAIAALAANLSSTHASKSTLLSQTIPGSASSDTSSGKWWNVTCESLNECSLAAERSESENRD